MTSFVSMQYQTRDIRSISEPVVYEDIQLSDSDNSTDLLEQGILVKKPVYLEENNRFDDKYRKYCNSSIIGIVIFILVCFIFLLLLIWELSM